MKRTEHSTYDVTAWADELKNYYEDRKIDAGYFGSISGPLSAANVERHRTKLRAVLKEQPTIPVDIFVWSVGQPEKPYLTKTGGTPYWPRDREWPTSKNGKPLSFFAQICLLDSQDLVSDLPGDVLLLFTNGGLDPLEIRWANVKKDQAIWTAQDDIPSDPDFKVPEFYGNIFRTLDYPGLFRERPDSITSVNRRYDSPNLFVYQAYKVGGFPKQIQDIIMRENERLVCQFSNIVAIPGYSFVNLKDTGNPRTGPGSYSKGYELTIGDEGAISVFQSKDDPSEFRVVYETH